MPRGVDWVAAEAFWLGLDPPRPFSRVAKRFTVSVSRVARVAKRDNWAAKAEEIDRKAAARAQGRIVRSREERVAKVLGIVDGLLDRYDTNLDGLELRPSDIPHLTKLAELLVGEATDRMSFGEVQEALSVVIGLGVQALQEGWPVERFLAAVRERLGSIGEADAA